MADEENDLEMEEEEGGGGKSKMMIIIIAAVVVLLGGGAAAFFMMGGEEPVEDMAAEEMLDDSGDAAEEETSANVGSAIYVPMPRPFIFNVPGASRDRLVQIKVQLMVRGAENEETAKKHIPLIEGSLLRVFSSANADDLVTEAGKVALQEKAVKDVHVAVKTITGRKVVEEVLFTGFVMQ